MTSRSEPGDDARRIAGGEEAWRRPPSTRSGGPRRSGAGLAARAARRFLYGSPSAPQPGRSSERQALVGVTVEVAAIERDDGDRAGVERVHSGREDLPFAARGDGAE